MGDRLSEWQWKGEYGSVGGRSGMGRGGMGGFLPSQSDSRPSIDTGRRPRPLHALLCWRAWRRLRFRGRFCEERTNLCESGPCRNGATCTGNHSSYTCHCSSGWTGTQCTERSMPAVDSSGKAIGCAAGPCFGGVRCEFEYNECDSNPCVNGGTCVDNIGAYECLCGRGYTGKRCEIKFDLCSDNPCPANLVCVDKGNSYSCECLRGFTEDNCGPHPQLCTPNPCDNGGTCWNLPDANVFYCACRAGFTGTTCQGILQEAHVDRSARVQVCAWSRPAQVCPSLSASSLTRMLAFTPHPASAPRPRPPTGAAAAVLLLA
ncbi:Neurogenic locus Notch protein [Portunus trituberculatus]|uniref:Neurogenic locus Notch protein n=1 Tax=Portunus trituberculatus TaxID=210409 RepID=A0A5B7CTI0_PORTR|nr:Neurogenic locus Notch protein [Portunus trituberculatus]